MVFIYPKVCPELAKKKKTDTDFYFLLSCMDLGMAVISGNDAVVKRICLTFLS